MMLDDLLTLLGEADQALVLPRAFSTPHSYRGYYDELAFEPAENVTVGEVAAAAWSAMDETFTGYKGGEFTMTGDTPCWMAYEGSSGGEEITRKLLADMIAAGTLPTTPLAGITLDPGMPDGTGVPGDSGRAQCAETTLHKMSSRGEITWRDIVWAHLARAIAETDPARLRAALAPVATTTDSWIAALDRRISAEPPSPDIPATDQEAEPHALAAEAVTETQHPTSETTRSFRLEHRRPGEKTWKGNSPGLGANWSWRSREKADQRLAEARDRWPEYEHQLVETETTVTEKQVDA